MTPPAGTTRRASPRIRPGRGAARRSAAPAGRIPLGALPGIIALLGVACTAPSADPAQSTAALSMTTPAAPDVALALPDGRPPTQLAREIAATADLVVIGRVRSVRPVGLGTGVVHVLVDESIHGPAAPGEDLVVVGHALDFVEHARDILYLKTLRGGPRYEVVRRIPGTDGDFAAKVDATRAAADLLTLPTPAGRDAAAVELVLSALQDRRPWSRRYGRAELAWLASARPDLFTSVRLQRLEAIASETSDPYVRADVESVTIHLRRRTASLPGPSRQESSSP